MGNGGIRMPYSSTHSSEIDMFVVCIIGIVLLLLLGLLSFLAVRHMRESFVEKHAQAAIDQMHALNGTYRNSVGQRVPGWNTAVQRVKLRSKRQFDTYNAKKEFTNYVARFYTAFLQIPLPVWRAYALGTSDIMSNVPTPNVPWYLFWNNYSARVAIKDHVSAQSYINVRWEWSYTSPQGRNSYSGFCIFAPADLYNALLTIHEERKRKESRSYQRSLMTPALRFAVMKRDHYRCRLCGKTADQGARLEVDHITPVSKGGKSVLDNLWTLCFECNRGKGAERL